LHVALVPKFEPQLQLRVEFLGELVLAVQSLEQDLNFIGVDEVEELVCNFLDAFRELKLHVASRVALVEFYLRVS